MMNHRGYKESQEKNNRFLALSSMLFSFSFLFNLFKYYMNMNTRFVFLSFFILLAVFAFAGCGSGKLKTVRVSGTVTLDGEAVEGATVIFSPAESGMGHPAIGKTDASGHYRLQTQLGEVDAGTTPGKYKVVINKEKLIETGKVAGMAPSGNPKMEQVFVETMPEKTAKIETTDMEAVVENKKENVFDFDLKSK